MGRNARVSHGAKDTVSGAVRKILTTIPSTCRNRPRERHSVLLRQPLLLLLTLARIVDLAIRRGKHVLLRSLRRGPFS